MGEEVIIIRITVSRQCVDFLYDYNSSRGQEKRLFWGEEVTLPLPRQHHPDYYFFHKHRNGQNQKIEIEHRKKPVSSLQDHYQLIGSHKMMGGVLFFRNQKGKVVMRLLKASDIQQSIRAEVKRQQSQEESTFKPHLIVRSFPKGYPLRDSQSIRLGKTGLLVTNISQDPLSSEHLSSSEDVLFLYQSERRTLYEQKQCEQNLTQRKGEEERGDEEERWDKEERGDEEEKWDEQERGDEEEREDEEERGDEEEISASEPTCRICMAGETKEDFFISPCLCKGSTKYTHISCLKEWILIKNKKVKDSLQNIEMDNHKGVRCQVCNHKYPKVVVLPDKSRIPLLDSKGETLVSFHHIEDSAWSNLVNRYMVAICKDKLITIGRLEESSICLREGSTSRRHCSICLNSKGQVVIKDNQSKFGTLLYDNQAEIKLKYSCRAFQIENVVFSVKLIK